MLLAAGFGTRFKPHTDSMAKPALPFLNLPLIAYPLFYLQKMNIKNLVINTHHLPGSVQKAVKELNLSTDLSWSDEQPQILNSAGGIGQAKKYLVDREDFWVVNADTLMLTEVDQLQEALRQHNRKKALATLVTCNKPGAGQEFGAIWSDKSGLVKKIGRNFTDADLTPQHFSGYYILSQEIFDYIPANKPSHIFNDVLMPLINNGEKLILRHHIENCLWFETGSEADYLSATQQCLDLLENDKVFGPILKEILNFYGNTFELTNHIFKSTKATIKDGAKISGFCVLAKNQKVPSGAEIKNAVIANSSDLHSNSIIHNKLIV